MFPSVRSLIKRVVGMFFRKRKEDQHGVEIPPTVTPPTAPRMPKKAKELRIRPPHIPREMSILPRDIVSRRRRKQMQASASSHPTPSSEDKLIIMESKDLYPFFTIDKFIDSKKYDERHRDCIKEILCSMRRMKAIKGGYRLFQSIQNNVTGKGFSKDEFSECFSWLDKSGVILWPRKVRNHQLISLGIKSDNLKTQKLLDIIVKAFHDIDDTLRRGS